MSESEKPEPKKRGGVRKKAPAGQKKSRRSDFEFKYLEPTLALARRRSEVEDVASYAHKLSHEEKAWMNQFMKEWNDASIGSLEEPTGIFHVTKEERKICHDRNNDRNRCDYTLAAAEGKLNLVESDYEMEKILYNESVIDDDFNDSEV